MRVLIAILFVYLAVVLTFVALSSDLFIYIFDELGVSIPWSPS